MTTPNVNAQVEQSGVRFAEHNEEISPEVSLEHIRTITGHGGQIRDDLNPAAQEELKQLKTTLQNNIQSSRMQHHAFEPVSLPGSQPVSRVPSGTTTPSRKFLPSGSTEASPRHSPPTSTVHSPPLTPAATHSRDGKGAAGGVSAMRHAVPDLMTPQRSVSPHKGEKPSKGTVASVEAAAGIEAYPKQTQRFSIGPFGDSQPTSQDGSPSSTPGPTAPGTPRPFGSASAATSDPSSRAKRQSSLQENARYRFGDRDPSIGYANSGTASATVPGITPSSIPPSSIPPSISRPHSSVSSLSTLDSTHKRSGIFGGLKKHDDDSSEKHGSKANLKRFFKFGEKREKKDNSGTKTPPLQSAQSQSHVPFADDHGLQSKSGKFGKMLGSGAGGSVRLMKRTGDGTVFAVKQFRDRHAYESEKEYNKKVTAEFCIGSTLHHGNIIETIDIVHEKGKWYEVMEFAPFDLFATVMTGKMGKDEITCSTLQILSSVLYLHSMGLAHRDLKLDNVVINEYGIMKLIDFGSAVVFRYPFENEVVLASGECWRSAS